MTPKKNIAWLQSCFILIVISLSGCAAVQSFPEKAQAGDSITLAVGSPEGMTRNNIMVEFIPDLNPTAPVDLTTNIRSVFNLYPDRTSPAWLYDNSAFSLNLLANDAGHAPWLTVVALDLPDSSILPSGQGTVRVTPIGSEIIYNPAAQPIDQVDIRLEILPGDSLPNPLSFIPIDGSAPISRSLTSLEPAKQMVIRPPNSASTGAPIYGAFEFTLVLPITDASSLPVSDNDIFIIHDGMGPLSLRSQLGVNWARNGDTFKVTFVSPNGMWFSQSGFSIVTPSGSQFGTPDLQSVQYFDLDGAAFAGPIVGDYSIKEIGDVP